ncbi:MAG: DNA adenine methylase [Limnobacter sp.]|uniref:DNA adenine methylase n=1 Tax=Limnobacter sp. TaxID=2003368 RepID=UPI00391D55F2
MPTTQTPLRYPGGKSQMIPLVKKLMKENKLVYGDYVEPFAGGCGIAMELLIHRMVSNIYINDIDRGIYAFWHSVINRSEELCELIEKTPVTIEEWHKQREIAFSKSERHFLRIGFATLFLNRTNRSGIIKGGVIGGKSQAGSYLLDCRFNKEDLLNKVRRIAYFKDEIHLSRLDAVDFLRQVVPTTSTKALINIDPPYYKKGKELYTSFYQHSNHQLLAEEINKLERPWMVTYDNADEIRQLYGNHRSITADLNYSAQTKRKGTELMVFCDQLKLPQEIQALIGHRGRRAA